MKLSNRIIILDGNRWLLTTQLSVLLGYELIYFFSQTTTITTVQSATHNKVNRILYENTQ